MVEYKGKIRLGEIGNTEWWTEENWKNHIKYIEKLKTDGDYGKEVEFTLILQHNSLFDEKLNPNTGSYKLVFLEL
jgi:hypothetical protein